MSDSRSVKWLTSPWAGCAPRQEAGFGHPDTEASATTTINTSKRCCRCRCDPTSRWLLLPRLTPTLKCLAHLATGEQVVLSPLDGPSLQCLTATLRCVAYLELVVGEAPTEPQRSHMKNINEMSTPELYDLLSLMEEKAKAHERLPSEVVLAILNGLGAMEKQRLEERRRKQVSRHSRSAL